MVIECILSDQIEDSGPEVFLSHNIGKSNDRIYLDQVFRSNFSFFLGNFRKLRIIYFPNCFRFKTICEKPTRKPFKLFLCIKLHLSKNNNT